MKKFSFNAFLSGKVLGHDTYLRNSSLISLWVSVGFGFELHWIWLRAELAFGIEFEIELDLALGLTFGYSWVRLR